MQEPDGITGPGEVFLEPAAMPGPRPFTPKVDVLPVGFSPTPIATPPPTTAPPAAPTTAPATPSPQVVVVRSGDEPGLYGGSNDDAVCDPDQLIAFLEADAAKAAAWAGVHGIAPSGVRDYIDGLTALVLTVDTRVTNHGYADGRATPRQAVLQAGTAVLVDDRGVPRARCACGNPLLEPVAVPGQVTYTGSPWPAFRPETVQVVRPAPEPVEEFSAVDVRSGAPISVDVAERPSEVPSAPTVQPSSPAAPTPSPTPAPTPTPAVATEAVTEGAGSMVDASAEGTIETSSVYSDDYPAALALDGDVTTSWFSAGPGQDGAASTVTWFAESAERIGEVHVIGNAANADPSIREGFGFEEVTVQVLDGVGEVTYEETFALAGTPDPEVVAHPDAVGTTVRLLLRGHEDPTCGGIAELRVGVVR